jgi:hypothetical protein
MLTAETITAKDNLGKAHQLHGSLSGIITDSEIDSECAGTASSSGGSKRSAAENQVLADLEKERELGEAAGHLLATSQLPLKLLEPLLSDNVEEGIGGGGGGGEEEGCMRSKRKRMRHSDPLLAILPDIDSVSSSSSRASIASAPSVIKGPWTKEVHSGVVLTTCRKTNS